MGAIAGLPVKICVGSGLHHWPGFINCDLHSESDMQVDCRALPFDVDYADEIHAIHFVEHVPRLDADNMLANWHKVLKSGGKLCIEVPSMNKIAKMICEDEVNLTLTLMGIFGDPRDPKKGMMHQWCYTAKELTGMLLQAGFKDVQEKTPHFHIARRDMRLEAVKA